MYLQPRLEAFLLKHSLIISSIKIVEYQHNDHFIDDLCFVLFLIATHKDNTLLKNGVVTHHWNKFLLRTYVYSLLQQPTICFSRINVWTAVSRSVTIFCIIIILNYIVKHVSETMCSLTLRCEKVRRLKSGDWMVDG